MATTTDPRAAGFDAALFRDSIRFAMNMGLPEDVSERVTFRWTPSKQYDIADPGGDPFDYTSAPTTTKAPDDVSVAAAVEFVSRATSATGTPVAEFNHPRVVITLLDEEFVQIVDDDLGLPDQIVFDGSVYKFDYVSPPQGLFDATIYTVYGTAEDEN